MKLKYILFFVLAMSNLAALAQPANPFLGTWQVRWMGDKRFRQAKLIIAESGGSWRTFAENKHNPCVGLEVPIAIQSLSPNEMTIKLKYSQAIPGCADSTVKLKQMDDKTITGKRGEAELTLSRE